MGAMCICTTLNNALLGPPRVHRQCKMAGVFQQLSTLCVLSERQSAGASDKEGLQPGSSRPISMNELWHGLPTDDVGDRAA